MAPTPPLVGVRPSSRTHIVCQGGNWRLAVGGSAPLATTVRNAIDGVAASRLDAAWVRALFAAAVRHAVRGLAARGAHAAVKGAAPPAAVRDAVPGAALRRLGAALEAAHALACLAAVRRAEARGTQCLFAAPCMLAWRPRSPRLPCRRQRWACRRHLRPACAPPPCHLINPSYAEVRLRRRREELNPDCR